MELTSLKLPVADKGQKLSKRIGKAIPHAQNLLHICSYTIGPEYALLVDIIQCFFFIPNKYLGSRNYVFIALSGHNFHSSNWDICDPWPGF